MFKGMATWIGHRGSHLTNFVKDDIMGRDRVFKSRGDNKTK
jgi:hypothetical protein